MITDKDIYEFGGQKISKIEINELINWINKNRKKNEYIVNIIEKLINYFDLKTQDMKFLKLSTNLILKKDEIKSIRKFDEDKEFYILINYKDSVDSITFRNKDELEKAFNELHNLLK